jgi:hypothetical protein
VYQNSNSESKKLIIQMKSNKGQWCIKKHKRGSSHTPFLLRDYEILCDWVEVIGLHDVCNHLTLAST